MKATKARFDALTIVEGSDLTTSIPEEIINLVDEYVDRLNRGENVNFEHIHCEPNNRKRLIALLNVARLTEATTRSILEGDIETSKRKVKKRILNKIEATEE